MHRTFLLGLLLLAIFIPLTCLDYHHFPYSDGAEHGAAVRELARNLSNPGEPMLDTYTGKSPRYVPSIVLMGATVRLTGMDILSTIKLFSTVLFVFFLCSVIFFASEYFQDARQSFWSVAFMLFFWGTGWHGANAYMFSALVHTAWYPSLVSFSCMFLALSFACRFLRTGGGASLAGWCAFSAFTCVNHPPTALFLWIASVLLIFEIKGLRGLYQPWFATVIILSGCAMAFWPYYDFYTSALKVSGRTLANSWDYRLTREYLYSNIVARTGPALAAGPLLLWYILKKRHSMLSALCIVSVCIYVAGYVLHINLAERIIFAAMFSAQLLASRFACTLWRSMRQQSVSKTAAAGTILTTALLAAGVLIQMVIIFQEYIRPDFSLSAQAPYVRYHDPTAMHKQFARYMGPGDVVFSDVPTSWGIPVYTGAKIVSLFHSSPHIPDNEARKQAVRRFYDPTLNRKQRLQILKRFNATRLIVHFSVAGLNIRHQIAAMGLPLIMENDVLAIYDIPTANGTVQLPQHRTTYQATP